MGGIPGRVSEPMAYLVLTEVGVRGGTEDIRCARGYIGMWVCRSGKIIRLFYICA